MKITSPRVEMQGLGPHSSTETEDHVPIHHFKRRDSVDHELSFLIDT